ncbi:Ferritin-like metal-binding protein YciE [Verrucomicrobium sp. GAS474]|uniref:ferritin-like domain-containing protein n=1 Tax=Verrucomicrobium sp. GAS474 TaxID=1882831 RepID=UPI00087C9B2F|nr:ferritin-like domain-containing protein [Verrucomicrobium sp. GAS474]SDU13068.1 Ferritin-like metal-binding protein YciE [Verrucomicrobium sp. GAS474]
MKLVTLKSLYIDELDDLHSAETQMIVALPRLARAARNPDLKAAFQNHLDETYNHLRRLELIFEDLEVVPGNEVCEATEGLIAEAEEMIHAYGDPDVRDVALIACAQRVEHYEIAAYGSARSFAKHLGFDRHVQLLQKTIEEEGAADKALTHIADGGWFTSGLNWEAARK